jgi:hypothetical protein
MIKPPTMENRIERPLSINCNLNGVRLRLLKVNMARNKLEPELIPSA